MKNLVKAFKVYNKATFWLGATMLGIALVKGE